MLATCWIPVSLHQLQAKNHTILLPASPLLPPLPRQFLPHRQLENLSLQQAQGGICGVRMMTQRAWSAFSRSGFGGIALQGHQWEMMRVWQAPQRFQVTWHPPSQLRPSHDCKAHWGWRIMGHRKRAHQELQRNGFLFQLHRPGQGDIQVHQGWRAVPLQRALWAMEGGQLVNLWWKGVTEKAATWA